MATDEFLHEEVTRLGSRLLGWSRWIYRSGGVQEVSAAF